MLNKWLNQQKRHPPVYKFPVTDITELGLPDEQVLDYLALALLLAHANPQQIRDQYKLLHKDAEDNSLSILKKYLEGRFFPDPKVMKGIARIGNFGEVLVSRYLIEFEGFWFPIYKLRFREKKNWAMRLSDLCLIKRLDGAKPLVCYGEVKTVSGKYNKNIAIEGHDSLVLGEVKDVLSDPEILHFINTILYTANRFDEAQFVSKLEYRTIEYDKRYDLFVVHSKEMWRDEILDGLEKHPLDQKLVNFSTKVVLISQLRQLIDAAYERSTPVASALIETMDRLEYLQSTYINLESLIKDRQFLNELAQVQSRAILEELTSLPPDINYTFNSKEVWRKCDYIFSSSSLLLREGTQIQESTENRKTILDLLKTVAQSFEFLSKLATDEDGEILLLNSAICYHIAGYHANAQCIAKKIGDKYGYVEREEIALSDDPDTDLTWFFRQALFHFLKRDILKLQSIAQRAITYIRSVQEKLVTDSEEEQIILDLQNLYGHLFFQKSLLYFSEYCKRGKLEDFTLAQKNIEKSHAYFQKTGDTRLGIIASELRTVLKLFEEQSTWANLERHGGELLQSEVWNTYLRNLAIKKSIVEFWTSQLKALQADLLTSDDSFVIQMPTSAGKTFIAELAILATLTNSPQKKCLYIAPYRALVNEIEDRLAETLGALGYRILNLAGGFEFDSFQNFLAVESNVLVTTPEKADLLFRTHPEYFENIATIVLDEGHMLDEGVPTKEEIDKDKTLAETLAQRGTLGRGDILEMLITRLKQKLPQVNFLFLSAVMPEVNVDDFVTWL